ncbi:bacillithiol biosynthesis deacetylase BshB1 [Pedobacter sp. Leaf194]|uniref:bacillithiol biosynthesis deacetylase BshB1 n=1 Tax=Pedobacter sp. Leaf194 TaxID=1736297 RepID=UPI000702A9AA|nr:bacillithiol biosynthesis deacetylase BshB1 [Pedobacter sp. Leaf194]KQS40581.1 bacillithiol biosynthesis deacetylase BshB1 [Pedobacter sp. Leaf194]RYD78798.1 MAG: bacillithiol biosynthesis deacetylase BshB1 [Sphingobacteriales bacterium]
MKLDILVIAVHPDDAELCCSGTILKHIALGKKVGIVDLTRGELGTRGTAETRDEEAADSAKILGLHARENLRFRDGFFQNDEHHRLEVIKIIRKYQPEIILSNALEDRHPDHGRAGDLVYDSVFLSGLPKIETSFNGEIQEAHRPRLLLQFIQDRYLKPDIIVDITEHMDTKIKSIQAFKTQFFNPEVDGLDTYISSPEFFETVIGRSREFGKSIGATFGEGFTSRKLLGVNNLFDLK